MSSNCLPHVSIALDLVNYMMSSTAISPSPLISISLCSASAASATEEQDCTYCTKIVRSNSLEYGANQRTLFCGWEIAAMTVQCTSPLCVMLKFAQIVNACITSVTTMCVNFFLHSVFQNK
jgi:hypothetical protein